MQRRLRLRGRENFRRLRAVGRTAAHPLLVISAAPNDLAHNRYGIITTTRLGNAVQRNRARRRIREAIRRWHPQARPGHDVVFIARKGVLAAPWPDLLAAVGQGMRRVKLLERA